MTEYAGVEPMFSMREIMVVHAADGAPVIDLDPIEVANNGDCASVWDTRLHGIVGAAQAFTNVRVVWSDTRTDVQAECPTCDCIKPAATYVLADGDDALMCTDCA